MIDRPTGRPPALSVGHPPVRTDDGPGAAEDRAGARPQPPGQAPGVRPEDPTGEGAAKLPVAPGVGRGVVLVSVFVCAACGLVYELELVALATYLMGDSVTQASVVLSVMVFAMGIGSLLAKRLRCCAAAGFGYVEALLALVGGGSAMALYADFAWFGEARLVVVGFSLTIGALIGAEMPLLMTLIQRIRAQDAGGAVADLFAADYVGALIGGLAFPFLLLPFLGQLTGALLTGVVNALAGAVVVLWLFRRDLTVRVWWRLVAANAVVVALLLAGAAVVGPFERAARKAVYGGEVRVAKQTDVQEAVLTGDTDPTAYRTGGDPLALFLDGRLRICSADEVRYDESLVHPAMRGGPRGRVLIVGGGDGMALREVLRYEDVRSVTVVDIDGQVPELAREDPGLRRLNGGALEDPRVRLETADAFDWLRERAGRPGAARYDVVVSDLPDPAVSTSTKLYSQEFYGLVSRAMSGEARLAVHAGAPGVRPHDYWTVESTLRAAGLETRPYLVGGRPAGETAVSGGAPRQDGAPRQRSGLRASDWGFVVAAHTGASPDTSAARPYASSGAHGAARPKLRAVSGTELARGRERAVRGRLPGLPPSSLTHPRYRG